MILGSKSNQLHLGPIFFDKITNKHNCHFHLHIGPCHRTRMVQQDKGPSIEGARTSGKMLNRMQKRCMYVSEGILF